jgi:5,5'-dehydrodivanillate O-demethylase
VRILGESLVLYRDKKGKLGLLEPHCAHRRAGLVYGLPDECGLRCTYHGWLYDAAGQCIEQPFEEFANPDNCYKDRIKIKAYPVEELGGLVFAYLGPAPAPLLPRWELLALDEVYREIGISVVPCNWLQIVENDGDPSHVVSTHWQFAHYTLERLGLPNAWRHERSGGANGFDFDTGEELPLGDHGLGATLFPYTQEHDDRTYQIRVPLDDTHTLIFWYMVYTPMAQAELGVTLPAQNSSCDVPIFDVPVPQLVNAVEPDWSLLDSNSGQDLAMWYSQGPIADRTEEHLGFGDKRIVRMRRLLEEQIRIVEQGRDPMNTFRDPAKNVNLVATRPVRFRPYVTAAGRPDLTNSARKYSGVYRLATRQRLGEAALSEPVQ